MVLLTFCLPALGQAPAIGGCAVFPADHIWNTPADTLPVEPNSSLYISSNGATNYVHADFGSGTYNGGPIGIPFTTAPGSQPRVPVSFTYSGESDPGPYPIPPDAPIEGGANATGDRHVLVLDRDNCVLYEMFYAWPQPDGSWKAGSGAIFDLKSYALRPQGWTSADAAGLAILPGLVKYDEVASGEIRHAIRFTVPNTRRAYVWPARHYASSLTGTQYPPMGQRFRLKANFDISTFSAPIQVILRALKKYGMILADNGSSWFLSGAPDSRWNNDQLRELHRLTGANFEAVDSSSLMIDPNSGQAKSTATNPVPSIASLDPASAPAGSPGISLRVLGANFVAGAVVHWDGQPRQTAYSSESELQAAIPSTDLAAAGTHQVTVVNPDPGSATSNTASFTVTEPAPAIPTPVLSWLDPSGTIAGAASLTLRVYGSGFVSASVVRWNGSARSTTFVSSGEIRASIPASDLKKPGNYTVDVLNPAPGGGSNSLAFRIRRK